LLGLGRRGGFPALKTRPQPGNELSSSRSAFGPAAFLRFRISYHPNWYYQSISKQGKTIIQEISLLQSTPLEIADIGNTNLVSKTE
jgi:hypothetical protein